MRPRKLVMENVGPFSGRAELDFESLGDIFLISGKTGSGKTTIFDSICYALYGTLPGSRDGLTGRLRSDFAVDDAECSVSLTFELGDRAYRIDRSPKQEKKKKRGSGTTTSEETAVLFELTSAGPVALSGKKTEADDTVRALLGLSDKEFSKIVLLPQGEFADFLRQSTTERRDVLRKLFPVDLAVRAREIALEKSGEARSRLLEAERALEERGRVLPEEGWEAAASAAAAALAAAKDDAARLEAEALRLAEALRSAEAEAEIGRRLAAAAEEERSVNELAADMEARETALAASRKARPLEGLLVRKEQAAAAAEKTEAAAAETAETAERARRVLAAAEEGRESAEAAEAEAASLRVKRAGVAEAVRAEEELGRDRAELAEVARRRNDGAARIAEAEKAAAAKVAEIARLAEIADGAERLDAEWESSREALERAKSAKSAAERAERPAREHAAAGDRVAALGAECAALERNIPVLEAELAEREAERKASETADAAALLAAELSAGEPCPVCGSRDHPAPAAARPLRYGLGERIEALRKSIADGKDKLSGRRAELIAARRDAERSGRELADARAEYAREAGLAVDEISAADWTPSAATAAAEVKALSERLTDVTAKRKEAYVARSRMDQLYKEVESAGKTKAGLDAELGKLAERHAALAARIAERSSRFAAALAGAGLGDAAATARDALTTVDGRLAELEAAVAERKAALDAAGKAVAAAEAKHQSAVASAAEAAEASLSASRALAAALADSAFADVEALRAALMDAEEETAAERRLAAWKERRADVRALRSELERSFSEARNARGDGASAEELALAAERLGVEREAAAQRRDGAAAALVALEKGKADYESAEERRRALAEEAGRLRALSDDLSGANPKKRAFDSWILGLYLAEVAAYATKRLERMSEGRFSLLLDAEGEGGRGRTGLDLAVFDAYTGRSRPCATLSGGESFMASISLALGLADSIQARSGGVRLDAVFIDEGFGSLDEASLDKALTILDEIRDHRMVGLISHVGELRSRIPSRVEVVKSGVGSRIRVEGET